MPEKIKNIFLKIQRPETEALLWIAGLVYLYFINPYDTQHYTFCAFKLVGIEDCPGCGLGNSISRIFHGDLLSSFKTHPLGIFALAVIVYRIIKLISMSRIYQSIIKGVRDGGRIKTSTGNNGG